VVVVSDALAAYVCRRGVEADRVDVLPNGVREPPAGFPERGDSEGPFVLGYEGTFKPWQGLLDAVVELRELAARLGPRPLVIDLWGDGPLRSAFVEGASGLDLRVRGWGSPDRTTWDAAWVPQGPWPPPGGGFDEAPPDRYFSPLKAAEAAAAGLPVFRGGRLRQPEPPPCSWTGIATAILAGASRSR
jgi:glycosyltransferase involved in cell wall biosynthesis